MLFKVRVGQQGDGQWIVYDGASHTQLQLVAQRTIVLYATVDGEGLVTEGELEESGAREEDDCHEDEDLEGEGRAGRSLLSME